MGVIRAGIYCTLLVAVNFTLAVFGWWTVSLVERQVQHSQIPTANRVILYLAPITYTILVLVGGYGFITVVGNNPAKINRLTLLYRSFLFVFLPVTVGIAVYLIIVVFDANGHLVVLFCKTAIKEMDSAARISLKCTYSFTVLKAVLVLVLFIWWMLEVGTDNALRDYHDQLVREKEKKDADDKKKAEKKEEEVKKAIATLQIHGT